MYRCGSALLSAVLVVVQVVVHALTLLAAVLVPPWLLFATRPDIVSSWLDLLLTVAYVALGMAILIGGGVIVSGLERLRPRRDRVTELSETVAWIDDEVARLDDRIDEIEPRSLPIGLGGGPGRPPSTRPPNAPASRRAAACV